MREILFRGKAIHGGQWIYGYMTEYAGTAQIWQKTDDGTWNAIVDPSTIGQYTGLTDKNGVKIFEGDIISYSGSREVVYFDTSLRIPCFTTGIGGGSSTGPHPYKLSKRHLVIGNIHDNPELLEGGAT